VLQKGLYQVFDDFEVATWIEVVGVLVDTVHIYILGVFAASGFSNSIQVV